MAELAVRRWINDVAVHGVAGGSPRAARRLDGKTNPMLVVATTVAVASREVGHRYWAVTVASEVRPAEASSFDTDLWFFEVGVVHRLDGTAAVGTPAVVPQPQPPVVAFAGRALAVPRPGDPLVATAQSFLAALLAGTGELSRYLSPGAAMSPVIPPPFTTVAVERTAAVGAGPARVVLRVDALATTAAGAELRLLYELTLEQRGGRWEVRHLSGAPTLRHPNASSPDGATTTVRATKAPPAPPTTSSPTPGA